MTNDKFVRNTPTKCPMTSLTSPGFLVSAIATVPNVWRAHCGCFWGCDYITYFCWLSRSMTTLI
jgi:hypothetical protein